MDVEIWITKDQASYLIREYGNSFFSVTFTKKNGELRKLNGRRGVTKYVTGEGLKYAPSGYGLLTVYDIQAKGYRMINANTITALKIRGINYLVK